jgi:hypothetical protein
MIEGVSDPILIATFLSLGVCFARALCAVAAAEPVGCARCGSPVERTAHGDAVCSCSGR